MAELHSLAEHRRYGGTLKHMFREQLVWGITNDAIQQCLTATQNVQTLKKLLNERSQVRVRSQLNKVIVNPQISIIIIMCHRCEKRTHHSTSVAIEKSLVTTVVRQVGHLKAACRSKLNKKQHPEWHVKEESSQDELQLLVKSTFIPYGRCTCSLKIDSSRFCSRHWFMADKEYP